MTTKIGYGPYVRIDGPPPLPQLHGLVAAADAPAAGVRIVPEAEDYWMNGAQVYPFPVDNGELFDTCADGTSPAVKEFGDGVDLPIFGAFTGYVPISCTTASVWNQQEFMGRATIAHEAVESAIIARQLMYGEGILGNPHLADGEGDFPLGDAPTSAENGLQFLERAIALSGRLGVIHCSPMMATSLLGNGFALSDKSGVIRTINGIVVVPDFGYAEPATIPTHAVPTGTQEWAFASGPIDIRRSEIFVNPEDVSEALDRGTGGATNGNPNTITYRSERFYLVDWDTEVQAAVLVDRCKTTCT